MSKRRRGLDVVPRLGRHAGAAPRAQRPDPYHPARCTRGGAQMLRRSAALVARAAARRVSSAARRFRQFENLRGGERRHDGRAAEP